MSLIKNIDENFLNEWKSVSDEVISISESILEHILRDSNGRRFRISQINGFVYVENKEGFSFSFDKTYDITVKYIIYNCKSYEEEKYCLKAIGVDANSEWDELTKTLTVVTTMVDFKRSELSLEPIVHEVEHMLQYKNGMLKRESLYEKMVEMIKRGKNDEKGYWIGMGLYYTFKHEQDAFIQQFYQYLKRQPKKISLDDAIDNFEHFKNIENIYYAVYDHYNDKTANKKINELGYTRKDYYKRLNYSYKRFLKKLNNVYQRWVYENKERFLTTEGLLNSLIKNVSNLTMLNEELKRRGEKEDLYPFEIEFIYYGT